MDGDERVKQSSPAERDLLQYCTERGIEDMSSDGITLEVSEYRGR